MTKEKAKIPYSSRAPIRHAYDAVLTRLARLAAFSTCPLLTDWGEADQRLEALAIDDLISIAIHLRRLLELTGQKGFASQVTIGALIKTETHEVPITRIINSLIHHTSLDIARRKADTLPAPSNERPESWGEWHQAFQIGMRPVAWLKSDQMDFLAFRVDAFASAVAKHIVGPIVDYCDSDGLYLEDLEID